MLKLRELETELKAEQKRGGDAVKGVRKYEHSRRNASTREEHFLLHTSIAVGKSVKDELYHRLRRIRRTFVDFRMWWTSSNSK